MFTSLHRVSVVFVIGRYANFSTRRCEWHEWRTELYWFRINTKRSTFECKQRTIFVCSFFFFFQWKFISVRAPFYPMSISITPFTAGIHLQSDDHAFMHLIKVVEINMFFSFVSSFAFPGQKIWWMFLNHTYRMLSVTYVIRWEIWRIT